MATWGGSYAVWKRRFSCYGPWETVESCVVLSSTSIYRRLQDPPRQPQGRLSSWGPPQAPHSPRSSSASGRLLKSESEDSGVEMASHEHSPSTPLGSESSFSLNGFPPEKTIPGEDPDIAPLRQPRSRSASKKLVPAAQRSRRQRAPGRCQRQLGRSGANAAEPRAEPAWEPREPEEPNTEHPNGAVSAGEGVDVTSRARSPGSPRAPFACPQAVPEAVVPVPGQGLKYLEHVCQMLERLARLQQDNRLLRQQAVDARRTRPDTTPVREPAGQDTATWRATRFRPRSCSDSQAPAPDPEPCRRTWGHSASSPSLLDPSESAVSAPTPDKDGRSHWGRVKVLLTRLTRRSLRGGRCR
ncbi:uncharacterized protein C8orf58 homolog isoform X2 [Cuculus canorus]|uniref:uncharacterized protein C8orf58 homolog isoform X2 n=1 Tax=Cuculus canorus TaxID=55661 RepID=UPI0023AA84BB|nr:uncharacterized protein C8orf58 homolog isoform X2 [Cuculus canorus]